MVDPGFPVGGVGPLMWALFGENNLSVKTKELGPIGGDVCWKFLYVDTPMISMCIKYSYASIKSLTNQLDEENCMLLSGVSFNGGNLWTCSQMVNK